MLNALLLPLMSLAAVGFVLSATAHLLALFGMQMPGGKAVWAELPVRYRGAECRLVTASARDA